MWSHHWLLLWWKRLRLLFKASRNVQIHLGKLWIWMLPFCCAHMHHGAKSTCLEVLFLWLCTSYYNVLLHLVLSVDLKSALDSHSWNGCICWWIGGCWIDENWQVWTCSLKRFQYCFVWMLYFALFNCSFSPPQFNFNDQIKMMQYIYIRGK